MMLELRFSTIIYFNSLCTTMTLTTSMTIGIVQNYHLFFGKGDGLHFSSLLGMMIVDLKLSIALSLASINNFSMRF